MQSCRKPCQRDRHDQNKHTVIHSVLQATRARRVRHWEVLQNVSSERQAWSEQAYCYSLRTASNKNKKSEDTVQSCRNSCQRDRHDQNKCTVIHSVLQATRTRRVRHWEVLQKVSEQQAWSEPAYCHSLSNASNRNKKSKTLRSLAESLRETGMIRTSMLLFTKYCKQQEQEEWRHCAVLQKVSSEQ